MSKEKFQTDQSYGASGSSHGYSHAETESAKNFVNHRMSDDEDLKRLLPIKDDEGYFNAMKDGVLLCKLLNQCVPGTIDERAINKPKEGRPLNAFQKIENHNLAIQSARGIGASVVNIGPGDLNEGVPHLCLGMTWQVIRRGLMQHITLKEHPELIRLLEEGEELADLLALPADQLLIRWVNYQMKNAGCDRRIRNFGRDINDSEVYTYLLNEVSDGTCSKGPLNTSDPSQRAAEVLREAEKIDCNEFVLPSDIVSGNTRLNFCFVANIFNKCPHLEDVKEEEEFYEEVMEEIKPLDDDSSREERNFMNWISSLGFEITDLYEDLANGIILLKLIDIIKPNTVNWRFVKKNPSRKRIMTLIGNCALAVKTAKDVLGCSLVSVGGSNIAKKDKKLVLAVVWQLMRCHYLKVLEDLGGGKRVSDRDVVKWANSKNQKPTRLRSLRDKDTISGGEYFIYLVQSISPQSVNESMIISNPSTTEDKLLNARYAISCVRKLGGTIFLTEEDLVEVKQKMVLTFLAALMKVDLEK